MNEFDRNALSGYQASDLSEMGDNLVHSGSWMYPGPGFLDYTRQLSTLNLSVSSPHTWQPFFITHIQSHTYLPERLLQYNTLLKWKASLTTVCWFFNGIAQEILYEDVWIGGVRDGRNLAERLGGAPDLANGVVTVCKALAREEKDGKEKWWTRLPGKKPVKAQEKSSKMPVQPLPVGPRRSHTSICNTSKVNPGHLIHRLRVKTPAMDKCSPHDLLFILQHCPLLLVFEDCKSIRRPIHPLVITESEVIPFGFSVHPPDNEIAVTQTHLRIPYFLAL